MDLTPMADALNARVSAARPITDADYLGSDGLMRCGICRKKLEHIVDVDSIIAEKKAAGKYVDEALLRTMFGGKKLRCACDCGEAERRKQEEIQRKYILPEKREYCFGKNAKYYDNSTANDDKRGNGCRIANRYLLQFRSMRENVKSGLYLYGQTGEGKTYTAASICNGLLDQGLQPKFTSVSGIMGNVSQYIRLPTILDGLTECDLVVLDDFTVTNEQITFEIIDGIISRKIPLILTSNKTPDDVKAWSARIHSRIFGACYDILIKSDEGDRRLCPKIQERS